MNTPEELKTLIDKLEPHELSSLAAWLDERRAWKNGTLRDCFVIMPFSMTCEGRSEAYWTQFFEHFLKPALEICGFRARRSKADPQNIVKGIMDDLAMSDIVLAALTDRNANVWYELGVRHSQRRGTVMICQEGQTIPFDLSQHGVVSYHPDLDVDTFVSSLRQQLDALARHQEDSPISSFLNSGLFETVNRAFGGRRQIEELISRECPVGWNPDLVPPRLKEVNQLWKAQGMQFSIIKDDMVIEHQGGVGLNTLAGLSWLDAASGTKSLYPEIKSLGVGLRVGSIKGCEGRLTAVAFKTLNSPCWVLIAEAHISQGQL